MLKILILEDETVIRRALRRMLERDGYRVDEAGTVDEARTLCREHRYGLVLADLRLPGAPGTEIIDHCNGAPVLVMTSFASVPTAVDAMKRGAADYLAKPFEHDELRDAVHRILREAKDRDTPPERRIAVERSYPSPGLIGRCPAMRNVDERIRKVAPTDATVLIEGESGTGKELVARAIHQHSLRASGPLVAVNCSAIPEGLIESELFGHEKGAFTGAIAVRQGLAEAACGGTLFLDEIGDLPLAVQARLLRFLQESRIRRVGASVEREVNVRVVAATNCRLGRAVEAGRFREDLYFRLRVVEIELPPLRERGKDIPLLAEYLLGKICHRLGRPQPHFDEQAAAIIETYPWPGNVREMENTLERAVILSDGSLIRAGHLGLEGRDVSGSTDGRLQLSLDDYFRSFVLAHQDGMTETDLARRLGITRKTLWEKRQRLGVLREGEAS